MICLQISLVLLQSLLSAFAQIVSNGFESTSNNQNIQVGRSFYKAARLHASQVYFQNLSMKLKICCSCACNLQLIKTLIVITDHVMS